MNIAGKEKIDEGNNTKPGTSEFKKMFNFKGKSKSPLSVVFAVEPLNTQFDSLKLMLGVGKRRRNYSFDIQNETDAHLEHFQKQLSKLAEKFSEVS